MINKTIKLTGCIKFLISIHFTDMVFIHKDIDPKCVINDTHLIITLDREANKQVTFMII